MSTRDIFVVKQPSMQFRRFRGVRILSRPVLIHDALTESRRASEWKRAAWLAFDSDSADMLLNELQDVPSRRLKMFGTFLIRDSITASRLALAGKYFKTVFQPDLIWLPPEQLVHVIHSDEPENRIIGGMVDHDDKSLLVYRGDLQPVIAPLDSFAPRGGVEPDFDDFEIIDWGSAVRFGNYEAAADAILYENDPEYRRRQKQKRSAIEKTFGASLRRLRLQRELRQTDFEPDVSAKTIARIENNEVAKPHGQTLQRIAEKLGVEPDEIETF